MTSITLDQAQSIIKTAQTNARSQGLQPLAIVILDSGGHLVAAIREDKSANKLFQVALGKADSAISTGFGTRGLQTLANEHGHFVISAGIAMNTPILAMPGGILIKNVDGDVLGSIGVSGDSADNDEATGIYGIESIGLVAKVD